MIRLPPIRCYTVHCMAQKSQKPISTLPPSFVSDIEIYYIRENVKNFVFLFDSLFECCWCRYWIIVDIASVTTADIRQLYAAYFRGARYVEVYSVFLRRYNCVLAAIYCSMCSEVATHSLAFTKEPPMMKLILPLCVYLISERMVTYGDYLQ